MLVVCAVKGGGGGGIPIERVRKPKPRRMPM